MNVQKISFLSEYFISDFDIELNSHIVALRPRHHFLENKQTNKNKFKIISFGYMKPVLISKLNFARNL